MSEAKTAEQLAVETKAAFEKAHDAVKAIAEEAPGLTHSRARLLADPSGGIDTSIPPTVSQPKEPQ